MAEQVNNQGATARRENYVESLVRNTSRPQIAQVGISPIALLPNGWKREDCSELLAVPARGKGFANLDSLDSFIAWINSMRTSTTAVYCKADYASGTVRFTAILNAHLREQPQWQDWGAVYAVPKSIEAIRWLGKNNTPMSQIEFAEWIEDNLRDITDGGGGPEGTPKTPSGGDMLQMALNMDTNRDSRLKTSVRLQNGGVELAYVDRDNEETVRRMEVFERFAIGIPLFLHGQRYRLEARLRYRVKDAAVSFFYQLYRPDLAIADAAADMVAAINERASLAVFLGSPS